MNKIKNVIFDLGGVILNVKYENVIQNFKNLGIKESFSFYNQKYQKEFFNLLETGKIDSISFIKEMKKHCKSSEKEIIKAWNSIILDLPYERVKILKDLSKNYNLFLLSNTNQIHINHIKQKIGKERYLDLYGTFDKVYYSHEIGLRKPDEEIFKFVIKKEKIIPTETFFIDDSIQHTNSAKKLGIKTYNLNNKEDIINLFPDIIQ